MLNIQIEKVAIAFITEKIRQIVVKKQQNIKISPPVGLKTEEAMRKCLNYCFRDENIKFYDEKIGEKLPLSADNFIKSGIKESPSFAKSLNKKWSQCDLAAEKNNHPFFVRRNKNNYKC